VVVGVAVVGAVVVVGPVAVLVGAAGAVVGHDSDSDRIGSLSPGRDRSVSGVPGGMSTVNGI
jgi:hypothetical protein